MGLFAALAPSFLGATLHQTSASVAGVVVFLIFATAAAVEVLLHGMPNRLAVLVGFALLVCGLWVIVVGLWSKSLPVFIVGTVVGGFGGGSCTWRASHW